MEGKRYILTEAEIKIILNRLALQVAENMVDSSSELIVVGIQTRGYSIARKITEMLSKTIANPIMLIGLSLNKDNPEEITLDKTMDFNNKNILIVDDVVNNGRTLTYSIKPFLEYYPKSIQTLVLVERMYKLFPIKADYIGLSIASTMEDHILVEEHNNEIVGAYLK